MNSSLQWANGDDLYAQGLTMGTLYIGKQGTGKTSSLARHIVEYFKEFPDRAIFVLDWSGSITDMILSMICQDKHKEELLNRVVYDELGNPEWVVPMPEFSSLYGSDYESQVQRVTENLENLNKNLVDSAAVLGGLTVGNLAPHFFRLLTAITNDGVDPTETWQITETKKLLLDRNILKTAITKFGSRVPESEFYLTREYLVQDIRAQERDLRTYSLRAILNIIETREVKARLGYYRPGWTASEAIEKGQLVIIDGARLIRQKKVQHYLFTQIYSLIMAEIKKRRPADPNDKPVSLILDEVYSILSIPGMATELSQLSPQYRSRKLQVYVVLQELAQLSDELRDHIWSFGNVVSFAISNFKEAYEISQQLFRYEPHKVKMADPDPRRKPAFEPDRGQYLEETNWLQNLSNRECVMRRYRRESLKDPFLAHVSRTKNIPTPVSMQELWEVKEKLLVSRAVRVRDALEKINSRSLPATGITPPTGQP